MSWDSSSALLAAGDAVADGSDGLDSAAIEEICIGKQLISDHAEKSWLLQLLESYSFILVTHHFLTLPDIGASKLQTDWEALIGARAEGDGQLIYGWLMKSHNRKGGPAHKSLHPKWLAGVSPCHTSVGTKTYLPITLVECNAHGSHGGLWLNIPHRKHPPGRCNFRANNRARVWALLARSVAPKLPLLLHSTCHLHPSMDKVKVRGDYGV
jgi:hypothetical protein